MWVITGFLITGGLIAAMETPYLIKKRMIKELLFFAVILLIGVILSILQALKIPIPNPLDWIIAIFKPIGDIVLGMLE